jgi:hypothetical protein
VALNASGEILRRLVGKSCKRNSDHGFDSSLAWEKERDEENAFRGWDEVPGDEEGGRRRGAVADLRRDIARVRRRGNRGKKAGNDAHLRAELRQRAGATSSSGAARRRCP